MKMTEEEFNSLFSRIDNGFVGPEEHVYSYQKPFAGYFHQAPVLDIGCGQGAFLRALSDRMGVSSVVGLDMDPENAEKVREKGYLCVAEDAFTHLASNNERYGGISMFHMIEHFGGVGAVRLLVLIYEALKEDGVFVLITPDFEEVGSHNFWLSSTHVRPYPLLWLQNAMTEIGFTVTDGGKATGGDTFIVGVKKP